MRITCVVEGVWPRLQSSHEKPHWISLDFNHFEYQHDGSEEEEDDGEEEKKQVDPEMRKKMVCCADSGFQLCMQRNLVVGGGVSPCPEAICVTLTLIGNGCVTDCYLCFCSGGDASTTGRTPIRNIHADKEI